MIQAVFGEPISMGPYSAPGSSVVPDREEKQFLPVHAGEFRNQPDKIIKVYYNVNAWNEAHTFDAVGNRTSETITLKGMQAKAYKMYPGCDRLMTDGRFAYRYDKNGNLVKKGDHVVVNGTATALKNVAVGYWDTVTGNTASETGLAIVETGSYTY